MNQNNSKANDRILAFRLAKQLKKEDISKVSGAGWDDVTHGWVTDYTGPSKKADGNHYVVVDYSN
jgi:hypothetical protein